MQESIAAALRANPALCAFLGDVTDIEHLFDLHPRPMWIVDANTLAFLAVNAAATRFYGYAKAEFLAMTADQIRPEEDVDDLRRAFADWSNNYSQRIWRHKKKGGEIVEVKVTSFNLELPGGRARLGVVEDLTGQRGGSLQE